MRLVQSFILFALMGATTALGQPLITHTFTFGPAGAGTQSFNLDMHCTGGDDWNASTIFIETFEGVTIVSPTDNTFGLWAPPFPDTGTLVDTYLRSPSAPPLFLPQLVTPSYTPEVATATWLDPAGTTSPADFLGARVALNIPGDITPTFEPIGAVIAIVEIHSVTRQGGGVLKTDVFTLYSGSDIGSLNHSIALTNHGAGTHTLDLDIEGTATAYWTSSTLTAESDGAVEFHSPLDNAAGEWAPPVPDDPTFVDTYLRSPSAPDAIPLLSAGSYSVTSLSATWADDPAGAAPSAFRLARLAFAAPLDAQPTLSEIGEPLLTLMVESVGENIDQPTIETIVIYDGIQNGTLAHTFTLTNEGDGTHTLDLDIDATASAYWTSSTITAESDGAAEFLSPLDNAAGEWAPPVPDDPTFVDTYLRSPSAPDAIPSLSASAYDLTSLSATWSDDPAGIAPSDFRLARLAFTAPPDAAPTLFALGTPLFTLTIESVGENTTESTFQTIVIYDGIDDNGPKISHTLTFGPAGAGTQSFNLDMHCTDGDDWNASTIVIETFEGVTIVSPTDNTFGQWSPPFPDTGIAVDTYLRSPSAPPLYLPQLVAPSYSPEVATATWLDPAGTTSPADFLGARVALNIPGDFQPTFEPIGRVIAEVVISSVTQFGGGFLKTETFTLYSGIGGSDFSHAISEGPSAEGLYTVDVEVNTAIGEAWQTSTATLTTFAGTTIVSPDDNAGGAWSPPNPDAGDALDTYVRSPSNAPTFAPALLSSSYAAQSASVTWEDLPIGGAPTSFQAGRFALAIPEGAAPTLSPIGQVIATLTVESRSTLSVDPIIDTYSIYDGVTGPQTTHTLTAGPSAPGQYAFDLNVSTLADYDWNAGDLQVETFGDTRIADPLDNETSEWSPPYPDDGTSIDTYVRAPSNAPKFKPGRLEGVFGGSFLDVEWSDTIVGVAPPEFLAARISLLTPFGVTPTLEPIGSVIATITIESEATGAPTQVDVFNVYDGIGALAVNHNLVAGPSDGVQFSYDVFMATTLDNDWNASTLLANTYLGTTIVSPDDNVNGAWFPPYPDDLTAIDTYVRSPSNDPTAFPSILLPGYSPTSAVVTWYDPAGTTAPQSFQGARLAIVPPAGIIPSLDTGSVLAEIEMASTSQAGGGILSEQTLRVYDGVVPRLTVRCTERNGRWAVRGRVTFGTPGSVVTATLDGGLAQALTVAEDGRVGFQFANAGAGTHTVTITLDSGTTVEEVIVCE